MRTEIVGQWSSCPLLGVYDRKVHVGVAGDWAHPWGGSGHVRPWDAYVIGSDNNQVGTIGRAPPLGPGQLWTVLLSVEQARGPTGPNGPDRAQTEQ